IRDATVTGVQTCALPIYGLERRDKLSHIICALSQPLEMRNALWSLEAEPEVRRSRSQPAFEHLRRRQRTKGVVHLNRSELRGVRSEERRVGKECVCRDER